MAGVAGAASSTNPVPVAAASGWAPLVTIALVTAALGGIMFWRSRRAGRDRGA
jgi:hypothetical protein